MDLLFKQARQENLTVLFRKVYPSSLASAKNRGYAQIGLPGGPRVKTVAGLLVFVFLKGHDGHEGNKYSFYLLEFLY